jgi:hypothetical protein
MIPQIIAVGITNTNHTKLFNSYVILTGFPFLQTESYLNWMGNCCLQNGKTDQIISFFKLAEKYYSKSKNIYASLEKAYVKSGNKVLSDEMQKKTIELQ